MIVSELPGGIDAPQPTGAPEIFFHSTLASGANGVTRLLLESQAEATPTNFARELPGARLNPPELALV